jgi:hypothetical protein
MILHSLMLHERNGTQWIGLPAREWTSGQGVKQFAKLIEFRDRAAAARFQNQTLAALDEYLQRTT